MTPSDDKALRDPQIQAIIGERARLKTVLAIVNDLLDGKPCDDSISGEYWTVVHDKVATLRTALQAAEQTIARLERAGTLSNEAYNSASARADVAGREVKELRASIDNAVLGMNTTAAEWAKVVDENARLRKKLAHYQQKPIQPDITMSGDFTDENASLRERAEAAEGSLAALLG